MSTSPASFPLKLNAPADQVPVVGNFLLGYLETMIKSYASVREAGVKAYESGRDLAAQLLKKEPLDSAVAADQKMLADIKLGVCPDTLFNDKGLIDGRLEAGLKSTLDSIAPVSRAEFVDAFLTKLASRSVFGDRSHRFLEYGKQGERETIMFATGFEPREYHDFIKSKESFQQVKIRICDDLDRALAKGSSLKVVNYLNSCIKLYNYKPTDRVLPDDVPVTI